MGHRDLQACRRRLCVTAIVAAVGLAVFGLVVTGCSLFGGKETTTSTPTTITRPEKTTTTGLPGGISTGSTTPASGATTTTAGPGAGDTTTSTAAAGAGGGTSTTEKLSSAEQRLANGHIKVMGFIKKVWEQDGKRYISIDYAEMLTGQAAVDAAIADGVIPAGGSLDNDYYIRNPSTEKRDFEVTPLVAIHTSSWGGEMDHPVTWGEFVSFWSASPPDEQAAFLRDSPWWIERDGQTIIKIDEQYLP